MHSILFMFKVLILTLKPVQNQPSIQMVESPRGVQEMCRSGNEGHGLVGIVGVG